ncbi:conserved hypothetical protein [Geotrichum candidum]|uniref:Uncharacterized protein n=1 Tax=Geotrichum candidum TaxID=1173061 RepID=A0A0J9XD57_GEOCN|nr:conserved hypothetical protein [Geotrichum candidum]
MIHKTFSSLFNRTLAQQSRRLYSTENAKPLSPHIAVYKQFGSPFVKVLSIALGTFFTLKYTRIALVDEFNRQKEAESSS